MTYALAAAGTGGHVYPALAVADALVAGGASRDDIVFIGCDRMEAEVVPDAGYQYAGVELRGLRRSLSPDNLGLPAAVWRAAGTIANLLRDRRSRVVTVFGGYVSVPAAWAASRVGAVLFLHEQNAVPGLANRIVSRRARTSFVAFPATSLPRASVTGNPLRPALARFDRSALREEALSRYGVPGERTVLGVLGGSLGARVLNDVIRRIADDAEPHRVAIVHLTGASHHETVTTAAAGSAVTWRPIPFESEMQYFYAVADVVLARAGALTISELAATGTPAVVVPYAAGTASHQAANARYLADAGGAVVVAENEIDRVPIEVEQLLADPPRRAAMADANLRVAMPDAANQIAEALREAADG